MQKGDDDDYSLWSNECPCCHDKDYTDNNGNQKKIKKNKNNNQCIHLPPLHQKDVVMMMTMMMITAFGATNVPEVSYAAYLCEC